MKEILLNKRGKIRDLFNDFFESEKAGGLVLIFVTSFSIIMANSNWQTSYVKFWQIEMGGEHLVHWINEGLMTLFFLLIGLELEREIYHGELSTIKNAALPIVAAIGGMVLPIAVFLLFNYSTSTQSGLGIPMATDIAFAVGILSLLGSRVPKSLKIFLTALAVIDDLGAIVVIAIFYSSTIVYLNLFIAFAIFAFLLLLNRLRVHNLIPYLIGGIAMWFFMLHSGVHATITGVLLAFAIPFSGGGEKSPSYILQNILHKPVAFFILPLFALANTGIILGDNWQNSFMLNSSIGIILGLVVGKPLGISLFSFLGVNLGMCTLPVDLKWKNIVGVSCLAGIGFTMSIFITLLAFDNHQLINISKISILLASFISGLIGYLWLYFSLKK